MKTRSRILGMVLISISLVFNISANEYVPKVIKEISLNKNWRFSKLEAQGKKLEWSPVSLPHTPVLEPRVTTDQWQGTSYYQREIVVEPEWRNKVIYLKFEAAMNHAEVWLNDKKLGEHLGGYLPFVFDITHELSFNGPNLLHVKLLNVDNPTIGPKSLNMLDFNTYGGLYRGVKLLVKNKLHITDEIFENKVNGGGIVVSFPKVSKQHSTVSIKTNIANDFEQANDFRLSHQLFLKGQLIKEVSSDVSIAAGGRLDVVKELDISSPELWSPESPNLHELVTKIIKDKKTVDEKVLKIGIRKFEFDDNHQLLINGQQRFLRGVNRHQEYPHIGYATSKQADYRDAFKIKKAGFDYVRLSHYPHSSAFLDAADELGLVVLDSILGWQYYSDVPEFKSHIRQTCRDLIRRDRNHPSILAWECSLNESWMPTAFIDSLNKIVHDEDPTRLSAGWQKEYDIYLQARQHRLKHYDVPLQPYNVSEYGDWEYYAHNAGLNQDKWQELKQDERSSRQLLSSGEKRLLQQTKNLYEAHSDNLLTPAFADGYWAMFDYNRGYAQDLESSGIMSLFRVPKYSYHFFQSQRSAKAEFGSSFYDPMIFIASEWSKNSNQEVTVFSNTEKVELWLNDRLIATKHQPVQTKSQKSAIPPYVFDLGSFEPGTLVAKGFINNEVVTTHAISSDKNVNSLILSLDVSNKPPVTGVKDVLFLHAHLINDKGHKVPLNGKGVEFESTGDLKIVYDNSALTENGTASVLLQVGDSFVDGSIKARLVSDKSINGSLSFDTFIDND